MRYTEASRDGSFVAWGNGFRYQYEALRNTLNIAHLERQKVFSRIEFDGHLASAPMTYVEALDKTNQIKALMYSNNTTINLADTMEPDRIEGIIDATAKLSRLAYSLMHEQYARFAVPFCDSFGLKSLRIKQYSAREQETQFYTARIQTQHNHAVTVRGCTMPALLAAMSDKTLRDLIALEAGHKYGKSAEELLNAAASLNTLSRVLDENFVPSRRLKAAGACESFEDIAVA